jgi:hypothetical protein
MGWHRDACSGRRGWSKKRYRISMGRRFVTLALLAALALLSGNAAAQITFTASVDKNAVAIGDTIVLTLTMEGERRFRDRRCNAHV